MMVAKRVDQNQKEIVSTFRQLGMSVLILSNVGKGCPDLCLGYDGNCYLVEIKNGSKPPSGQKLTEAEQHFFDSWKGNVCIINSIDEAIRFVHQIREETFAA